MEEGKKHSSRQTLLFIVILCFLCALILSITSFSLESAQQNAKEFDRSKQMLIAAKILDPAGYFGFSQEDGSVVRARFEEGVLILDSLAKKATANEIKEIARLRIRPLLTDSKGNVYTLEEKNLSLASYLAENQKGGFASLPYKLFYMILPNEKEAEESLSKASAIVIPVSGFGLWAPIYGYIALENNGDTVIGTTWYEHAETPGLGANITEPWWQKQFFGKLVFQEMAGGETDFQTADMGIVVVKGKVRDVYGNSPKAKSAVDGMSGATLTGDGVTAAYRNSLTPYRAFLIKLQRQSEII